MSVPSPLAVMLRCRTCGAAFSLALVRRKLGRRCPECGGWNVRRLLPGES
jgi:DNA-directed RNA polymerase subunit RPC12/RpoP